MYPYAHNAKHGGCTAAPVAQQCTHGLVLVAAGAPAGTRVRHYMTEQMCSVLCACLLCLQCLSLTSAYQVQYMSALECFGTGTLLFWGTWHHKQHLYFHTCSVLVRGTERLPFNHIEHLDMHGHAQH